MSLSIPYGELEQKYEELKEAVWRVRELHSKINGPADDFICSHCFIDEYVYYEFPCPTIKALDGKIDG